VRLTASVNEGSHSVTCHQHVHPQMERAMPVFTPQLQSPQFGQYSFPIPTRVRGGVSLGDWLHTEVVYPSEDRCPSHINQAQHTVTLLNADVFNTCYRYAKLPLYTFYNVY